MEKLLKSQRRKRYVHMQTGDIVNIRSNLRRLTGLNKDRETDDEHGRDEKNTKGMTRSEIFPFM